MMNCIEKAAETAIGRPIKPIVISANRYEDICYRANQVDKKKQIEFVKEERKYREYLKHGNEQLVAKFKGNIRRTQEKKFEELKEQAKAKHLQLQANLDESKLTQAKERRDRIVKAQQLVERLKPGPRELRSAAIQSEVIRSRNMQLAVNAEYQKAIKAQKCAEMKACGDQANAFAQEQEERAKKQQEQTNIYKQELLQVINENNKQRIECKKKLLAEQQAERNSVDREIQEQIVREKEAMEKKRAMMRKNALDAMIMVEQRRLRERMYDEVDDRLNCVYNVGKRQLDGMRNLVEKKIAADRAQRVEENMKLWVAVKPDYDADLEKRVRRDISRAKLAFTEEEREKVCRDRAAKKARIEEHLREVAQQKEAQRRAEEEKRFEMAQRFKNIEVNCLFNEEQKKDDTCKAKDYRSHLNRQVEETKRLAAIKREEDLQEVSTNNQREEKFFFEYARELMEDAYKKNRPMEPFTRVVNQFKREHNIDCDDKVPRHLVSNVKLGHNEPPSLPPCNEPSTSGSGTNFVVPQSLRRNHPKGPRSWRSSYENIRESRESCGQEGFKQRGPSSYKAPRAGKQQGLDPETLSNCLRIETLSKMGKNVGAKLVDFRRLINCNEPHPLRDRKKAEAAAAVGADCTSSTKIRYSLAELKKLNKYA